MADPSKTEEATPRRRDEFRKKGNIAKSPEISAASILLACVLLLNATGAFIWHSFEDIMTYSLRHVMLTPLNDANVGNLGVYYMFKVTVIMGPLLLLAFAVAYISNLLQVGFLYTLEPISPKLSKIDPIAGFGRLFSKRSLGQLVKSIAKVLVIGYLAYSIVQKDIPLFLSYIYMPLSAITVSLAGVMMEIALKVALLYIVIAIIDYFFQRYMLSTDMRMTKQEIRDEHRRQEGSPEIKNEIRRRQREMGQRRMMQKVPQADVIVTNPFHIAIALQYDAHTMSVPKVIAKGARLIAEQIKELGRTHNIPIVENPEVARALYASTHVDHDIPGDLFNAVAEILTYVYKLSGKRFGIS